MKINNIFLSGRMNKDADERMLEKHEYTHAENINVANAIDSDTGVVKNTPRNFLAYPTALTFHGGNPKTIGSVADDASHKIYWYVATDTCSYICEYNRLDETASIILEDTRVGNERVLRFDKNKYIHSAKIIIDTENERKFLVWTDGLNPPRKINIDRAKTYGPNNFTEEDISVIKAPPIFSPIARLSNSQTQKENYIKDKFIHFAYRFKYLDGEYSALSPFSNYCFLAKEFFYDYEQATNESMENAFNQVLVTFKTGDSRVTDIELVYRESKATTLYVVEKFNKQLLGLGNDEDFTFKFSSPKVNTVLAPDEATRLYDNVPTTAETMEVIGNRLVYANYTENYKLCHFGNEEIKFDFTVNKISFPIVSGVAQKSVKSNRNYEVGLVYVDENGRMSTVQTCEGNNVHVPAEDSKNKNTLQLTINHLAPYWAKYYRAFIKETETTYDIITPVIFHKDEDFVWVKIEKADIDKVKEGDFLVVKSDTAGIKDTFVETKILEFAQKDRNFLESSQVNYIAQEEGTYLKFKPTKFSINDSNYEKMFSENADDTRNRSGGATPRITNETTVNYFEGPNFYATTANSQNDLIVSGAPSGVTVDQRFEVVVQSTTGSADTFKWRVHDPSGVGDYNENVTMTTSAQALSGGLSVHFAATTGHTVGDTWFINGRTGWAGYDEDTRSNVILKGFDGNVEVGPGSVFRIQYFEGKGASSVAHTASYTSSRTFPNIEEFWHEVVKDEMTKDIPEGRIKWRRGVSTDLPSGDYRTRELAISNNVNHAIHMIIESTNAQGGNITIKIFGTTIFDEELGKNVYANGSWNFVVKGSEDSLVVLETKPKVKNDNIYYEIGQTYNIDKEGYHEGADSDQTQNEGQAALVTIDWFNCFAWGNGIESFKHKDSFLGDSLLTNNRALTNYAGYRENKRIASLTYSGVYNQSTNYNALNEFNLSLRNFRDLDDQFGKIMKIESRDTDLIVFQENKVTKVLFGKSVLANQDGSENVVASEAVLGTQVPFVGEYGISTSAASLAKWFNNIYFADERRGVVMRLGGQGLEEISQFGMRDWFRENIRSRNHKKLIGGYDPHNDNYILSIKDPVIEWREDDYYCAKGTKEYRPDKYYCKQDLVPIPVPVASPTPVPVAPTYDCNTASFSVSNGTTGATIGLGSDATVSAGVLNSVSPATYQSGSTTYTANITVPAGYTNAGNVITICTTTATGTTAPTPTPVPVAPTPTPPTFGCGNAAFTVADGTTGSPVSASVSAGTLNSVSPSTYQAGSNTYTANITVTGNFSNAGDVISICSDTATGTTTFTCSNANLTIANGTVGQAVSATVSNGAILGAISPSTYQSGTTTYTAAITVPNDAQYSNAGQSIIGGCSASATGSAPPPTPVPTVSCINYEIANLGGYGNNSITFIPCYQSGGQSTGQITNTIPYGDSMNRCIHQLVSVGSNLTLTNQGSCT